MTSNPFSLDGRTALVTGASRGIGAACARALDRAGARVAVSARGLDDLREVAADLRNRPVVIGADLATEDGPSRLAAEAAAGLGGRVDIIVNNAGVGVRQPSVGLSSATIDRVHYLNVRAVLLLTTALIPTMVARGGGAIVNISSISGVVGTPQRSAYAASKGAVDALTRSLAMEFGPAGIRVNSVAPGVIATAMWTNSFTRPGVIEHVAAHSALRRHGTPEDVADVVVFLASDAARFVTAQTLSVDGGMAHTVDLFAAPV